MRSSSCIDLIHLWLRKYTTFTYTHIKFPYSSIEQVYSYCKIIYDSLFSIQGLSPVELYRTVEHGFTCHFNNSEACSNISIHGWIFLIAYIVFSISALNFLSMCESAVFTVAAATVSLPLSGIWWSIYKMDVHGGELATFNCVSNYCCYFFTINV